MRSLFTVDYPDPNNLLAQVWWSQEQGFGRQDWSNNVFDQLVDRAAAEMNTDRRMAIIPRCRTIAAGGGRRGASGSPA